MPKKKGPPRGNKSVHKSNPKPPKPKTASTKPQKVSSSAPPRSSHTDDTRKRGLQRPPCPTLLRAFSDAYSTTLRSPGRDARIQALKTALYNRDFGTAFGTEENLEVYTTRWSPTRAMCYGEILGRVVWEIEEGLCLDIEKGGDGGLGEGVGMAKRGDKGEDEPMEGKEDEPRPITQAPGLAITKTLNILSIGGTPAELGALSLTPFASIPFGSTTTVVTTSFGKTRKDQTYVSRPKINLTLLDSAPWGTTISKLHDKMVTPPTLSQYASASAREANMAMINGDRLSVLFRQRDVLEMTTREIKEVLCPHSDASRSQVEWSSAEQFESKEAVEECSTTAEQKTSVESGEKGEKSEDSGISGVVKPSLITLFFTLNELYTTSGVGKTTAFLLRLTEAAAPGSLLLVVDSAGSYSETAVGSGGHSRADVDGGDATSGAKAPGGEQPEQGEAAIPEEPKIPEPTSEAEQEQATERKPGPEQDATNVTEPAQPQQPKRRYPTHWLLSHTLLKTVSENKASETVWKKVLSEESVWFRVQDELRELYPLQLENMRYQVHMYRARSRKDVEAEAEEGEEESD